MTKSPKHYLDGLDKDIRENLVRGLRENWTYHSTGIEGNSLTLEETAYVLSEGLTVDGKPIKDHNEVIGHGKAVDWANSFARRENGNVTDQDLFELHKLIQTEHIVDFYKPHGAWKIEPNGTMVRDENGNMEYVEFAAPNDVEFLIKKWIAELNSAMNRIIPENEAPEVFASIHTGFVRIHPFWDGNGRMARILSNLPLLRSGFPPVVIQRTYNIRERYIALLQNIQKDLGTFTRDNAPIPISTEKLSSLTAFCHLEWQNALKMVKQAQKLQAQRS